MWLRTNFKQIWKSIPLVAIQPPRWATSSTNFIEDEWRCCMKKIINNARTIAHDRSWIISKPPQAFCNTKPRSYYHQVLTFLPLCQKVESSPNSCNALCVKRFMERHGVSDVEEPMQHLLPDLRGLP